MRCSPRLNHHLLALALNLALALPAFAAEPPSLILSNARVYTVNPAAPTAEAIAISGDRILAVGSNAEIKALAGPATETLDLARKTVAPGFIDAHGHLAGLGQGLLSVDLVGTKSYEEIVEKIRAEAVRLRKGQWILGRGWDQNDWPEKEFQTHAKLSAATPEHPVFLVRVDGHAGFANAKALELAQLDSNSKDPEGGKILRGASREPTGVLIDSAMGLVQRRIPPPSGARIREAITLAIVQCKEFGLTGVHDAGVTAGMIELYKDMIDAGVFELRVYAMIGAQNTATIDEYFARGPLADYGGCLTVRSVKVLIDGALGSRGAALFEPYSDDPGNKGLVTFEPERLLDLTMRALPAGFQICCHAIGDRGNRMVLDIYENAMKENPGAADPRLRIEHAQIVAPEDIPRFAALRVVPSMQPTHATSDMPWAERRVGPERIKGAYAWRKFLEAGCRIAGGSDFPVENANPLWGFYAATARQDHEGLPEGGWRPEERMTREEALRAFTIDAAYAEFQEAKKGSIEPGKLADLTVLSRDIMTIPPREILETHVEITILGGKIVYRR